MYEKMKQHTIDPFVYIRQQDEALPFIDLPLDATSQEALLRLHKK
jgi:hypothetical protein